MNSKQIRFILEVFAELSFVGKEEDGYRLSERPEKKELEQSPLYVRQKERAEVETELLYSSYQTLCRWLLHAGETDDYRVREEKVEHGL